MDNLSEEVERVFKDCLFTQEEVEALGEEELAKRCIVGEGLITRVGFEPARIGQHAAEIRTFVDEMQPQFFTDAGGGSTFLNLCNDRHGNQWTDLHQRMEQLMQLAIAAGIGRYCLPREMWSMLPGGVPYVAFTRAEVQDDVQG